MKSLSMKRRMASLALAMLVGVASQLALRAADGPAAEGKKLPTAEGAAQPAIVPSAGPVKVEIRRSNGEFRLYRGGQPYYIKGAVYGGDPTGKPPMKDIAARGGNSVRAGRVPSQASGQWATCHVEDRLPSGRKTHSTRCDNNNWH